MSVIVDLSEEEKCSRCGIAPRASKGRNTWCRECKAQWQREYRAGAKKQYRIPDPIRNSDGCLIWQGHVNPSGYGYIATSGSTTQLVHRYYWERGQRPHSRRPDDRSSVCDKDLCRYHPHGTRSPRREHPAWDQEISREHSELWIWASVRSGHP